MISVETRQNRQGLPKKNTHFFSCVSPSQHIFVFPRSQLCLKFRQYAYRKCRFAKIGIEASRLKLAGLAFTLPIGQKKANFMHPRGDALEFPRDLVGAFFEMQTQAPTEK